MLLKTTTQRSPAVTDQELWPFVKYVVTNKVPTPFQRLVREIVAKFKGTNGGGGDPNKSYRMQSTAILALQEVC